MKKNLIFGTAGHIDHGKSSLIQAITGKNPDRLKEEQEKQITIELGFAGLELPDANISFIDVPGHEGLIKTMISGSVGFDSVLFCIDAKEGIMPQTIEHFNIINTIGIRSGIVAITKSDTCSHEQLSKTIEKAKDLFNRSSINIVGYVPTSIKDKDSIERLKDAMNSCAKTIPAKLQQRCYLVRVDRVFSLKGFGTIATGTSLFGQVSKDTTLFNNRNNSQARVKNIQVHDKDVEKSFAGERTALNLPELSPQTVKRGDILSDNNKLLTSKGIYAKLKMFSDIDPKLVIKHNKTYSLYIGATPCEGKIIFYDRKRLENSQDAECFIKLDKEIITYFNEPFIIRGGNPQISIAGGKILGIEATYPNRKYTKDIMGFLAKEDYDSALKEILEVYHCGLKLPEPIQFSGLIRNELALKMTQLNIANFQGFILDNNKLEDFVEKTLEELNRKKSLSMNKIQHSCDKMPEPVRFDIINRIVERAQRQDFIFDGHLLKKHEKDPFEELALKVLSHMKQDASLSNSSQLSEKMEIPESKISKCLQYLCNRSLAKNIEGNNHVTMELINSFVDKAVYEGESGAPIELGVMRKHFDLPRKLLVPLMDSLDKTGLFINKNNRRYLKERLKHEL